MTRAGCFPSPAGLASWNLLYAVAGAGFDENQGQLTIRPHALPGSDALQLPIFGPRAWFWLDFRRSLTNANQSLRLRMVKRLDDRPFTLRSFVAEAPIAIPRQSRPPVPSDLPSGSPLANELALIKWP